ncbi:MAG: serine/threonine-protein kinase [Planctomycetota bacterium]
MTAPDHSSDQPDSSSSDASQPGAGAGGERPLQDLQDEILDRLHAGEPVDREALLAQHPLHAEALRRFFGLLDVIEATPGQTPAASPSRLGEFEIVREIGRGGMGVVYEARQVSLNRPVALKVLPPALRQDAQLLARFRREAEAAGRLRHPNIVPVYSVGESAGAPFFAMELVEGRSLADVIRARRAGEAAGLPETGDPWRRWVLRTVALVADALAYAHGRGILHRDVKPGNILLEHDGTPRLTDFGLALDLRASELTQVGEVFGSPLYMSPEQAFRADLPVDARTDVYSLGVTLYELLTLRLPYEGNTHAAVMSALETGRIVAPRQADPTLPEALERVLFAALARHPRDRYATAADFAADLRLVLDQPHAIAAPRRDFSPVPGSAAWSSGAVRPAAAGAERPLGAAARLRAALAPEPLEGPSFRERHPFLGNRFLAAGVLILFGFWLANTSPGDALNSIVGIITIVGGVLVLFYPNVLDFEAHLFKSWHKKLSRLRPGVDAAAESHPLLPPTLSFRERHPFLCNRFFSGALFFLPGLALANHSSHSAVLRLIGGLFMVSGLLLLLYPHLLDLLELFFRRWDGQVRSLGRSPNGSATAATAAAGAASGVSASAVAAAPASTLPPAALTPPAAPKQRSGWSTWGCGCLVLVLLLIVGPCTALLLFHDRERTVFMPEVSQGPSEAPWVTDLVELGTGHGELDVNERRELLSEWLRPRLSLPTFISRADPGRCRLSYRFAGVEELPVDLWISMRSQLLVSHGSGFEDTGLLWGPPLTLRAGDIEAGEKSQWVSLAFLSKVPHGTIHVQPVMHFEVGYGEAPWSDREGQRGATEWTWEGDTQTVHLVEELPGDYPEAVTDPDLDERMRSGLTPIRLEWLGFEGPADARQARVALVFDESRGGPLPSAAQLLLFPSGTTEEPALTGVLVTAARSPEELAHDSAHDSPRVELRLAVSGDTSHVVQQFLADLAAGTVRSARLELRPSRAAALSEPGISRYWGGVLAVEVPVTSAAP